MKTAIVHDWLVCSAGAEKVLEQLLRIYPEADLYAIVDFLPDAERGFLQNRKPATSFIQRLPMARGRFRSYFPLMPFAVEQFDLSSYDLVISSSHCVAKGVITGPDQTHVCLCYSPMRYAWDMTFLYLREAGLDHGMRGWLAKYILHRMRMWDVRTAHGVDHFIAISEFVKRRISKTYGRTSVVIYPPVDVDQFSLQEAKDSFYLTVSRLVPYKRVDLIIKAFARMPDRRLVIIGSGPEYDRLKSACTENVTMLGFQSRQFVTDHMQRARAFVYAAEEDFGIVAVEAQSCGTPVIAYGKGGVAESVVHGRTGILFQEQEPDSLIAAVEVFESKDTHFDALVVRHNAERFSVGRFCREIEDYIGRSIGMAGNSSGALSRAESGGQEAVGEESLLREPADRIVR